MSDRYAIYLAPPPDSDLWRFGCRVLLRDAATGADVPGFAPPGWTPEAWAETTAEPRRYGFHATLKAPFRLRDGLGLEVLEARLESFAASSAPFDLGPLTLGELAAGPERGFVALRPEAPPEALAALERRAVTELDDLRAPLSVAERARRAPERLSERQRAYLDAYGYPYVCEEFRLHFTLTGATREAVRLAEALEAPFADDVRDPCYRVDAIALFVQSGGGDFRLARRYPFPVSRIDRA